MPRPSDLCVVSQTGNGLFHRHMQAAPEPFLRAIAPYREDVGVSVEGLFTWGWLADLCAQDGMPCVRGHALSMHAIHGGTATHDKLDAPKIAVLLRGGMLPQASVYPAALRATRALRRRRRQLPRKRAELLAHIHTTNGQEPLPEIGKKIADPVNRAGVAERLPDPAVQKRIAADLARLGHDVPRRRDGALAILKTATQPNAQPLYLLRTGPGSARS